MGREAIKGLEQKNVMIWFLDSEEYLEKQGEKQEQLTQEKH